ncbi:MAG: DUF4340 domain-containing protein [Planctomycetes bacterium]|nr:DUF4340 domain-containing protein [Planctomycetota bacterium]
MSEWTRTGIFVALAVVLGVVAFLVRPAQPEREAFDDSGERFWAAFEPLDARSLEIVTWDDVTATVSAFNVAHRNGIWSIPSHEDYPADAESQLGNAAASVVDLVKGPRVSDRATDHALYGVIDPTAGKEGAGTRVTMKDESGNTLMDLIIGKEVKESNGLRFVRVPDRDRVYTAKVETEYLSTEFETWIEADLLKLDPYDLREIVINDYTVDEANQRVIQGELLRLRSDTGTAGWELEAGIADSEELQNAKIEELKRALDDLAIVDVHRKPAGLSRELRAEDALELDREAQNSLARRGFYIARNALLSNEGETTVTTKDGVRYVLRFGEIAQVAASADLAGDAEAPPVAGEGAARFLFVMAEFDEARMPEPAYEEVPAADPDGDADAIAERERITADNDRKRADHERKIADARQQVAELNDRFADWYYVIADEVYRKIRLTRGDLVTEKAAPAAGS